MDREPPVARITPVAGPDAVEQLIAEGVVQPMTRPRHPAPEPVVTDVRLSEIVLAERR